MSRSTVPLRRALALAVVFLLAVLAAPVFIARAASHDNNVQWAELGHNSRDPLYRSPGGAVPTGTAIRLRLRAADGDLTAAQVRVWNDRLNQQNIYNMVKVASGVSLPNDPGPYEFWEYTLPASADPTVYWYRFIAIDGSDTDHYEDDAGRTGGWGEAFDSSPDYSYQLTVYDADFQTPDWVKNAVIYQIFADRFRDGDNANNPTAGQFFYGAFDTIVRSNTTNWNARICDPRSNAGSTAICADKYSNNFYGGDLQGIIDKLDYLDGLGVTALYLNPIFESPSNHKYDTKDFLLIDDNFGDLADYQALVAAANQRGIKIILDGVFNHSSSDSRYFDRYSRWDANGNPTTLGVNDGSGACEDVNSLYEPWYTFFNYAGTPPSPCSDNRDYPKWFGIFDSLPVFQHDYTEVRDYFIGAGNGATSAVGPYWIDQGAAGWRLDVAPEIDHGTINDPGDDYWEAFREAVKSVDPDAYIVGEEWGNATSWTIGGEWDATMNYQFAAAVLSFWRDEAFTDNDFNSGSSAGVLNPLNAGGVADRLLNLEERYAPEAFAAMMNLFNSHDTNRVLFLLNHDADLNNVALYNNPNYDWSDSITRYKGALIMQMTLPGAPTIYYGDEVGTVNPPSRDGSQWQDDPYNRAPFPWLDETGTPYYAHMQSQTAQDALSGYVSDLTGIRNSHAALRTGSFDVLDAGNGSVFAYGRKSAAGDQIVIVLVNKSGSEQEVTVNLNGYAPSGADLDDLLSDDVYTLNDSDQLIIPVPPRGGRIMLVQGTYATPDTVSDLTATANGATQIDLDWSAAAGAASYDVYRSRLSGGGYSFVGNTTNTDFADTGLSTGVTYYYVVVARAADDLASGWSNEASATTNIPVGSGWRNVQWPCEITNHVIGIGNYTPYVYGQIWVGGFTDAQSTPVDGIIAQVGYGPTGDAPTQGTWTWFDMEHNPGYNFGQSNDEFQGRMLPTAVGSFKYTTRYSGDGGLTWHYAINGPNAGCTPGDGEPLRDLTVIQSSDTTAPAAPTNLAVTGVTSASITLGWDAHPDTDGDLYAFRVYRGPVGGPYAQIAQLNNPSATSYVDTNVTAGQTYEYYVTAVDTSLNESGASNTVEATAENLIVDVTFKVTVPSFTPDTVYLVGGFGTAGYPDWDPGAASMAMTETSPGVWEITLQILDGTQLEYKYARGSWDKVEKQADGFAEVNNRPLTVDYGANGTQLVEDTVANWRDRIVTGHTPADGATGVDPSAVITASWNKWMPTPPPGTFTVTGPNGAVAGSFGWDDGTKTHTFTPDAPLVPGEYTVTISGNNADGDNQFVPVTFTFTVDSPPAATLTVVKEVTGGPATWSFDFTGDLGPFTLTDADSDAAFPDLTAGEYAFSETAVAGYSAAITCDNGDSSATGSITVSFDATEDVTCTVTNTYTPPPAETEIFVTASGGTVAGVTYKKYDILKWDGSDWSKWFNGADAGLGNSHDISAIAVPDGSTGEVYLNFEANRVTLPGISGRVMGQDVVYYDGQNWSLYIDGDDLGLTTGAEKIDSLEVMPNGAPGCEAVVLLSTRGPGRVNDLGAVRGEDVLGLCLTQSGADTQYEWLGMFDGSAEGMPANATIALSMASADSAEWYFLTRAAFNVDSAVGGHSMIFRFYDDVFDGPHWRAADHGLSQMVDGLDINGPLP